MVSGSNKNGQAASPRRRCQVVSLTLILIWTSVVFNIPDSKIPLPEPLDWGQHLRPRCPCFWTNLFLAIISQQKTNLWKRESSSNVSRKKTDKWNRRNKQHLLRIRNTIKNYYERHLIIKKSEMQIFECYSSKLKLTLVLGSPIGVSGSKVKQVPVA